MSVVEGDEADDTQHSCSEGPDAVSGDGREQEVVCHLLQSEEMLQLGPRSLQTLPPFSPQTNYCRKKWGDFTPKSPLFGVQCLISNTVINQEQ